MWIFRSSSASTDPGISVSAPHDRSQKPSRRGRKEAPLGETGQETTWFQAAGSSLHESEDGDLVKMIGNAIHGSNTN